MAKKQPKATQRNEDPDERYFQLIQRALAVCKIYRPKKELFEFVVHADAP